jgi:hypothetical protein
VRVAIHQPNFMPWCGYFAKMGACDVFVFLDDAQMSKGSYVNRSRMRDGDSSRWLTIPVHFRFGDTIANTVIADTPWQDAHLRRLREVYSTSSHFEEVYEQLVAPAYALVHTSLAEWNMAAVRSIAGYLDIGCEFVASSSLAVEGVSDDRLIALVRALGGVTYVSGPGGQKYQDPAKFAAAGLDLEVRAYAPVKYEQAQGEFVPGLTILDALFNLGGQAAEVLAYAGGPR